MTRKNIILSIQTALFFGLMLAGTLFGQKIGDAFRPTAAVLHPAYRRINYDTVVVIDGSEIEATVMRDSILIPFEALAFDSEGYYVYLLQEQTEVFGSYHTLAKHPVTVEIMEDFVLVLSGLGPADWIVSDIKSANANGEPETGRRIVPLYSSAP